jgi:hypothetical protein
MPSLSGYQSKQSQAAAHAKRSAPTGACAFAGLSPVAHIDAVANYEMKEGPPKGLRVEALSVPTNCDSVPRSWADQVADTGRMTEQEKKLGDK